MGNVTLVENMPNRRLVGKSVFSMLYVGTAAVLVLCITRFTRM